MMTTMMTIMMTIMMAIMMTIMVTIINSGDFLNPAMAERGRMGAHPGEVGAQHHCHHNHNL